MYASSVNALLKTLIFKPYKHYSAFTLHRRHLSNDNSCHICKFQQIET